MGCWRPCRDEPSHNAGGAQPHNESGALTESKKRYAWREDKYTSWQDERPAVRWQLEGPPALRVAGREIGEPQKRRGDGRQGEDRRHSAAT